MNQSATDRLERQIRFLFEVDKLKEVLRRTRLPQSQRPENSAEHTWHIVLMATILSEHATPGVDVLRVMKMLLIHDIVEIDAGDTFGYDTAGHADKREREVRAAERIFGLLPADQATEIRALWEEFEADETAESKFALAMDRFQAVMVNYLSNGGSWREHNVTADRVFARNQIIANGSPALWTYARNLIADAVAKGHLSPRAHSLLKMLRAATIADAGAIAGIYNEYVLHTIITFEEEAVTESEMAQRITDVFDAGLPWFVWEEAGKVLGYAYASKWKSRCAYRYAVESSIYLQKEATGRGLGKKLYLALIAALRAKGIHSIIGGIALPNPASVGLSEKLGFQKIGHFKEVGWKFNQWIDVGYWELIL